MRLIKDVKWIQGFCVIGEISNISIPGAVDAAVAPKPKAGAVEVIVPPPSPKEGAAVEVAPNPNAGAGAVDVVVDPKPNAGAKSQSKTNTLNTLGSRYRAVSVIEPLL